ncbi:MAG: glycoside hydrolase family 27 protein [Ginsengibacter sp.]
MKLFFSLLLLLSANCLHAQQKMLAATPPMGWNSWNKFGCNVSEQLIKKMADVMVSSGMKDAGYEYIVIDDCWQVARDSKGNIVVDSVKFPSGMKALADYIHSKGLKFGLYSDAGTGTCQNRPGSYNHEEQDANQYAAWGVDYLKYDWCNADGLDAKTQYTKMSKALKNSGHDIVFSMCEWGSHNPWYWAQGVGNLWRTTGDIVNCFDCKEKWGGLGWVLILDEQEGLEKYSGPGHWNDPDMLEVGNGKLTEDESKAHFSFWCLLDAPLIAGNDLANMTDTTKNILTNRDIIAINQDPLGIQGSKKLDEGNFEVWTKPLKGGDYAVILFNRGGIPVDANVVFSSIGIKGSYNAKDLWNKKDMGLLNKYSGTLKKHEAVVLHLYKQ